MAHEIEMEAAARWRRHANELSGALARFNAAALAGVPVTTAEAASVKRTLRALRRERWEWCDANANVGAAIIAAARHRMLCERAYRAGGAE